MKKVSYDFFLATTSCIAWFFLSGIATTSWQWLSLPLLLLPLSVVTTNCQRYTIVAKSIRQCHSDSGSNSVYSIYLCGRLVEVGIYLGSNRLKKSSTALLALWTLLIPMALLSPNFLLFSFVGLLSRSFWHFF